MDLDNQNLYCILGFLLKPVTLISANSYLSIFWRPHLFQYPSMYANQSKENAMNSTLKQVNRPNPFMMSLMLILRLLLT